MAKDNTLESLRLAAAKRGPVRYGSRADEARVEQFAKQFRTLGNDYDYSASDVVDGRLHYNDKGKLPWHATFSGLSKYAGLGPHGTWDNTRPDGSGDFHLTKEMMTNDRMGNLQWMVDNKYTDGDRYFLPNGKQMEARKVADRLAK